VWPAGWPSCLGCLDGFLIKVGRVLGITGGDPSFTNDDGSASPDVVAALAEFAAGHGTEHAVLVALAGSRLLVPVVATRGVEGEKASEMAMPTLIGLDGRRAMPAFTSLESMSRWQSDARPVPVTALAVWQSACADSSAVVIDVAGPVPFAVEGARLAALARGEAAPQAFDDPDVHEIVTAVLADQLDVASFELQPDDSGRDLAIVLVLTEQAADDAARMGAYIAEAVMACLGGRLRRGVAIWLGSHSDAG
jgi:hypothetical protein